METKGDGESAVAIEPTGNMYALNVSAPGSSEDWVIDSGCTHNMTSRRDWFVEFQEKGSSKILYW